MALRVSYKNRIGWYVKTEKFQDESEQKYKNWICHANCLWADMYFYKLQEDSGYGKKGQKMSQVIAFWLNIKHLKRAIADNAYCGVKEFHFYAEEMDSQVWSAVKVLAKAGKKVIIETKKK